MYLVQLPYSRTISVELQGGLGNQMFQYAAGLTLARKFDMRLNLDTSFLNRKASGYTQRTYELNAWNITAGVDKIPRIILKRQKWLREGTNEDPFISKKTQEKSSRLMGFWQDPKIFFENRNELLKEFSPKSNIKFSDELISEAQKPNSLGLHIRRGDYVSNPNANAHHGICDVSFYKNAAAIIRSKIEITTCLVFSDDPDWVAQNLDLGFDFTVVNPDVDVPAHDLWLMSQCHHHIISNSTFSWWAAWLSTRSGVTICPKQWTKKQDASVQRPRIALQQWECI